MPQHKLLRPRGQRAKWPHTDEKGDSERTHELQVKSSCLMGGNSTHKCQRPEWAPGLRELNTAQHEANRRCRAANGWALNSAQVTSDFILRVAQGLKSEAIVLTPGEKPDPQQGGTEMPVNRLFRLEKSSTQRGCVCGGGGDMCESQRTTDGSQVPPSTMQAPRVKSGLSSWAASTFTCCTVEPALQKFLTEIFSQRSLHVPVLLFIFFNFLILKSRKYR